MSQWKAMGRPEMIQVPMDSKKYKETLADIAKILLDYFSQLDPKLGTLPTRPKPVLVYNKEVR